MGVGRNLSGLIKKYQSLGGIFCHNFFSRRGEWTPCLSASCRSCYHIDPGLGFPLNRPLRDESMYYRRMREDENRYLVVRKRDWILAPHQCEKCWFVNLCGCCPDSGILADIQRLELPNRANLDIFWRRDTSTIHEMLGYAKEVARISREAGIVVLFTAIKS